MRPRRGRDAARGRRRAAHRRREGSHGAPALRHDRSPLRPREPRDDVRHGRRLAAARRAGASASRRLARAGSGLRHRGSLQRACGRRLPGRRVRLLSGHADIGDDDGSARAGRHPSTAGARRRRRGSHVRLRVAQRRVAAGALRRARPRRPLGRADRRARREQARPPCPPRGSPRLLRSRRAADRRCAVERRRVRVPAPVDGVLATSGRGPFDAA